MCVQHEVELSPLDSSINVRLVVMGPGATQTWSLWHLKPYNPTNTLRTFLSWLGLDQCLWSTPPLPPPSSSFRAGSAGFGPSSGLPHRAERVIADSGAVWAMASMRSMGWTQTCNHHQQTPCHINLWHLASSFCSVSITEKIYLNIFQTTKDFRFKHFNKGLDIFILFILRSESRSEMDM